jgi:hypothetical protein
MKQTQHPAMGCELSLLVHACHVCVIATGHAGSRVHYSCGFWSVIHMLTIESVTPKHERHAIFIFSWFLISYELNCEDSSAYVEKFSVKNSVFLWAISSIISHFEKYHCFTLKWGQDHKFIIILRYHLMVGFAPQKTMSKMNW